MEAQLLLVDKTASEIEQSQKMLDAYEHALKEAISKKLRIYIKEKLIRLCMNINGDDVYWAKYNGELMSIKPDIDPFKNITITKVDALKKAFQLTQDLADDISIPLKNRLKYKKELIDLYKRKGTKLPTDEANETADQMSLDFTEVSKAFPREYFELRMQQAFDGLESVDGLKSLEGTSLYKAVDELYAELLGDKNIPIEYQAKLRMILGMFYMMAGSEGGSAYDKETPFSKLNIIKKLNELVNDVIDHPKLPFKYRQGVRVGLIHFYAMVCSKKRIKNADEVIAEIYRLYEELLNDPSLRNDKKEAVKAMFQELVDKSKGALNK